MMVQFKKIGLFALMLIFMCTAMDTDVWAQKVKKDTKTKTKTKKKKGKKEEVVEMPSDPTPWATKTNKNGCLMYGADSVKAMQSASLYRSVFKQDNYAEALGDWTYLYENAPGLREQTFKDGEQMYKKFFEDETDPAKKKVHFEKLMEIYDQRAICWGKSAFLSGKKGLAYAKFYPEEKDIIFDLLSKSVANGGNETSYSVFPTYFQQLMERYQSKEITGEDFEESYGAIQEICEHNIANNVKKGAKYQDVFDKLNPTFEKIMLREDDKEARENVRDCASAKSYYGAKYDANPSDPMTLKKYYAALVKYRCTGDPVFVTIAEKLNEMEPSASKCKFIARSFKKNSNFAQAESFYNKALELEGNSNKKAEIKMELATMFNYKMKDRTKAMSLAREAASMRPDWGEPWILIGNIYAARSSGCSDNFEKRMAICVAMDNWGKAKRVDPASANKAQDSMNNYYGSLPTKKELFQRGLSAGQSYNVSCLGVSTTIRHQ